MRDLYKVCYVSFIGLKLHFNLLISLTSAKNRLNHTFNLLKWIYHIILKSQDNFNILKTCFNILK